MFSAFSRRLRVVSTCWPIAAASKSNTPTSVIAARRFYLTKDRPVTKKYLTAMVEGLQLYRQNKNYASSAAEIYQAG